MMKQNSENALDGWLLAIWLAVLTLGPLTLLVFALGLPLMYDHLLTLCPSLCEDGRLTAAAIAQWQSAGLPISRYAGLQIGLAIALALVCFVMASLLFWQRPRDRMAIFTALLFIGLGGTYSDADEMVGQMAPWLLFVTEFVNQTTFGILPVLFLTLPDGRFVPGWSRWLALAIFLFAISDISWVGLSVSETALWFFFPVWALAGPTAQIYRYRRLSTGVQRQQIKWVIVGLCAGIMGFLFIVLISGILNIKEGENAFIEVAINIGTYICISLIPISIGLGVLRYRLWDIDVIIRKTLVYTLLSAVLALVYFGSVTLLQSAVSAVSGQQSAVATVLSTLLIAALFTPLRRRVQNWIDRRFYRQKYDAQQVLAAFAVTARDETNLENLTKELQRVVGETMQPEEVGVWLQKS